MKTICVDVTLSGVSHTGIGRYVENLVKNLPSDPEIKVIFIKSKHHPYSLAYQIDIFSQLLSLKPDLLHVPHFTIPFLWPGKTIITIHDLIKHVIKGKETTTKNPLLYWPKYFGYRALVWFALKRANHIITPTNYWKNILVNDFNVPESKISVTYEGVDQEFFNHSSLVTRHSKPFLVYTGNLYPHKNVSVLIEAAEKLKMKVKLICARSVFASRLPKSEYVEFLGRLSDEEVIATYKNAFAFVFPSLLEGFGLTGLEAMATGLPVIAARASCLPEVYQDAAIFFDPLDSNDLVEKINKLKSESKLREELIKKGHNLAKNYTWVKMGNLTWEVYLKELL